MTFHFQPGLPSQMGPELESPPSLEEEGGGPSASRAGPPTDPARVATPAAPSGGDDVGRVPPVRVPDGTLEDCRVVEERDVAVVVAGGQEVARRIDAD